MGRVGLAFRAFWRTLRRAEFAEQVRRLVEQDKIVGKALPEPAKPAAPVAATPAPKPEPRRSEALTLLAVLQREARLVDFLKENIGGYSDDQVGSAVRDIHRDASGVLDRLFALKAVRSESEGASIEVPRGFDAGRIRLVGNVAGEPPYRGALVHAGWEATKVELPEWTGTEAAARVVAPAEVEIK